jgi:hypothetical protein
MLGAFILCYATYKTARFPKSPDEYGIWAKKRDSFDLIYCCPLFSIFDLCEWVVFGF